MARHTVYLPDRLYRRAQAAQLPLTKICQEAIAAALVDEQLTTAQQIRRAAMTLQAIADDADRKVRLVSEHLTAHGMSSLPVLAAHVVSTAVGA